jgi:hypothetical protein
MSQIMNAIMDNVNSLKKMVRNAGIAHKKEVVIVGITTIKNTKACKLQAFFILQEITIHTYERLFSK